MNESEPVTPALSPFHEGEQRIQRRLGVRQKMEALGRRVIRDYLPAQHREFYRQLPFLLLGFMDSAGNPWASLLSGSPGFVFSPGDRQLHIDAQPFPGDPILESLKAGSHLGVLGIALHSRRRNRLSTRVTACGDNGIELQVMQSFGNCPKYIQPRELTWLEDSPPGVMERDDVLTAEHRALIEASDTFFVASSSGADAEAGRCAAFGVDVSHRGGRPGFVKVAEDGLLTIPDFPGNNHFNTLGNFLLYPRAGLLFPDFARGHLLYLTGAVSILWDTVDPEYIGSAQRSWTFRPQRVRMLREGLPFRCRGVEDAAGSG